MSDQNHAKPVNHAERLRQVATEIERMALPKRWQEWLRAAADEADRLTDDVFHPRSCEPKVYAPEDHPALKLFDSMADGMLYGNE